MKKVINSLLAAAVIIPVILMLWPFAEWSNALAVILRVIPSAAVQVLLCRIGRPKFVKVIPVLLTGALAAWGTYLYFTSPHWSNAAAGDLVADYVSPFICCVAVSVVYLLTKKTHK